MAQQLSPKEMIDILRPYFMPNIDLEMWERLTTYHYGSPSAVTDHFRGTALRAIWSWAGAPFAAPGTVTLGGDSRLVVSNMAGTRAFLYQATINQAFPKWASVALSSTTVDVAVGVRLDDGTDNNYVEVVLIVSQASPTQWTVEARQQLGGGGVTVQVGDALTTPMAYVVGMTPTSGSNPWASWTILPLLETPLGLRGRMWKPNVAVGALGAWTPTRAGIVFDFVATANAWESGIVDWTIVT